jgi:hypothetical protein
MTTFPFADLAPSRRRDSQFLPTKMHCGLVGDTHPAYPVGAAGATRTARQIWTGWLWIKRLVWFACLSLRDVLREARSEGYIHHQTCKCCGRRDKFDFTVSDEIWELVIPLGLQNRVVCLPCFDRFAVQKRIDYAAALERLCFAGDKAVFNFAVSSAKDCNPETFQRLLQEWNSDVC